MPRLKLSLILSLAINCASSEIVPLLFKSVMLEKDNKSQS